jgi:hypothetical protein
MVGEIFTVQEVDEYGAAWAEKSWSGGEGLRTHAVGLAPHEMETIDS